MKFLIAIVLIATIVAVNALTEEHSIPDAHKERANQIVDECRKEFSVADEEFEKLKAGEIFEASENAKCFTNCFQEKAGITKDGVFQIEEASTKFSPTVGEDKIKAIIEACKGETGNGKCETSYKLHQCFKKNNAY